MQVKSKCLSFSDLYSKKDHTMCNRSKICEGLPGVLGNKGTLAKYRREQGNISQFLGSTGNKISNNYSTKTFLRVWEHGNIHVGQFWKGTREQGPPWETLICASSIRSSQVASSWTETRLRSIKTQKREQGQYSAILTKQAWSMKDLLYGKTITLKNSLLWEQSGQS